jgi:hypothetical protein
LQLNRVQSFVRRLLDARELLPPPFQDAELADEQVLERGIKNQEGGMIFADYVIDVVGRLLRALRVLRTLRAKLDSLLRAEEYAHERRYLVRRCVAQVRGYDLRASLLFVAEGPRVVIIRRFHLNRFEILLVVRDRFFELRAYRRLDLLDTLLKTLVLGRSLFVVNRVDVEVEHAQALIFNHHFRKNFLPSSHHRAIKPDRLVPARGVPPTAAMH